MGTTPTPATQTAGTVVPAATINSQGNLATYLAGRTEAGGSRRPLCKIRQTVAQSIPASTSTAITFDTEDIDYDNGHSITVNTSRYTAQTAGWYLACFMVAYSGNATGSRGAFLRLNGTTGVNGGAAVVQAAPATNATDVAGATLVYLNVGDYVEVTAIQGSGGSMNTDVGDQSSLTIQWVSV